MITVAKTAGFCYGVKRAVDNVYKAAENGEKIATIGQIIHNPQVIADLASKGINAYDKGGVITRDRLYDLKAIPALYLLDSEKMVMAKDCTDVEYVEHLISEAETI